MTGRASEESSNGTRATTRPESLLISLFGIYALPRQEALGTSGIIDALARLDIGESATRATLNRMTKRGLLHVYRQGRRAYFGLTGHAETVLADGQNRINAEVVNRSWDGRWTVLGFSVPETRRGDRHALRNHLRWAGFGPLQSGLWIAPSPTDLTHALEQLNLLGSVKVFRSELLLPTRPEELVREAWNLDRLADGYSKFLERWQRGPLGDLDELSRQVLLHSEWLLLIREDPRLPVELLPDQWPGILAEELFWKLRDELAHSARTIADSILDRVTQVLM